MSSRRISLSRAILCLAVLVCGPLGATVAQAESPTSIEGARVDELLHRLHSLEDELRAVRQRQDSVIRRLPPTNFDLVSVHETSVEQGGPDVPDPDVTEYAYDDESCDCCCGCYPCQCPLPEAACLDCPRVSTLRPYSHLHIFGAMKLDMLFSTARPLSPGSPFFLATGPRPGNKQNIVSIHGRQSTLAAAFTGPQFGGFQSGGTVVTLFFNDSVIADRYGLLPLQAYGELRNNDWRFAAGLMFDVFSPGIPTVLPFSALAATGNSGNSFRGQLRLERFLHPSDDKQWTIQFALSEPINSTIDPTFRVSEDNGWPNVEGRVALGLGPIVGAGLAARRPIEVGVSGVVGQLRTTDPISRRQVVADVWGLSCDFRGMVTEQLGFAGEVFTGQSLGTYNGGILQNINPDTFDGIRTSGGWIETFFYWTPCLHNHVGYGLDDPIDRDVSDTGRTFNSVLFANLIWDLNQTFRVGFEFTWRETNYKFPLLPDNQGAGFHTQVQWAF